MRYLRTLTISLAIHLLLALAISLLPVYRVDRSKMRQTGYVDLLEKPVLAKRPHQQPRDEQLFVRSAPAPAELLTKDNKVKRFASEEEQNVLEETKAQENGLTVNRSQNGSAGKKPSFALKENSQKSNSKHAHNVLDFSPTSPLDRVRREILEDKNGLGGVKIGKLERKTQQAEPAPELPDGSRPLVIPGFAGAEKGYSTLGNDLPNDIKVGNFTALNTDRHLYYSFYSRMEEAIRYRWETYVRAALYEIENGAQKLSPRDRWTTRLEVILDPQGRFEKALMSEGSGVRGFDVAPVQAFREAAKFPNPPHEMVKEDGKIHIFYSFTIDVVPRYASRGGGG